MSRYYALVLVPGDTPEEEACEVAAELLYPHMHAPDVPLTEHKFDYMYGPGDIAELTGGDITQHMWRVGEILETLADLEVEAVLTPDGTWHETEAGQLWDDDAWLQKARQVLEQHRESLALRHVLHI